MKNQIITSRKNSIGNQVRQDHIETLYEYTQKKLSANSTLAYRFGLAKFETWLDEHGYSLNLNPGDIALYVGAFLSDMAKTGELKYRSIVSYHAAIKSYVREKYHIELDHPEIKNAMRGIRNTLKQTPVKKEPIKAEHISIIVSNLKKSNRLIDKRDRALLLIGFSGAFRRSELVKIEIEHITYDEEGISIHIPSSKTDQAGNGQHVEIPKKLNDENCPIDALRDWLKFSGITSGPIFRSITRHGRISNNNLTGKSVADILKRHANGLFESVKDISGHSLRRGFVISSLEVDVDLISIMNQTRHASVNTLKEYSSEKKNYKTNALNSIQL